MAELSTFLHSASIVFEDVSQSYDDTRVIDSLSLEISAGEFFSILGPSGSGKTTCLRLIAGFDMAAAGKVLLGGRDVTLVPPYLRDVNTVFQDYALFPHLTVLENVEYGLRMKGIAAGERRKRAVEALEMVELGSYRQRQPIQLSGGQRQRVALARALVNRPPVLLLDEPLGALDLRLREQMQSELKNLHRQLGITFVYVTHDQGEAMSMSDRIAVLRSGRIDQLATPRELYCNPATAFVAEFVGAANVLRGDLARRVGAGSPMISVRAECVSILPADQTAPDNHASVTGVLADIQYHGANSRFKVVVDDVTLTAAPSDLDGHLAQGLEVGMAVRLSWPASATNPLSA